MKPTDTQAQLCTVQSSTLTNPEICVSKKNIVIDFY